MKKKFIYGCGVGWCGTTSLHRTLSINQRYLHTGFRKESLYLTYALLYNEGILDPINTHNDYFLNLSENKISFLGPCKEIVSGIGSFIKNETPYNEQHYFSVLKKFTPEQINYFLTKPYTLDKYLEYINLISNYSEGVFDAVGDFLNQNFINTFKIEKSFDCFKKRIEENFDFKFLLILRDPIRSIFSRINCGYYNNLISVDKLTYTNVYDLIFDKILDNQLQVFDYAKFIKKVQQKYGKENIHYVIMEDFFNKNDDEIIKLENFLNTKINEVYPCAFVPDKGINAPKIQYLEDQWMSDHEVLTPEFYKFLFKKIKKIYDDFEKLHGCLPADWGRPIDYGY